MQSAGRKIAGISVTVFSLMLGSVVLAFLMLGRGPGGVGDARFAGLLPMVMYLLPILLFVTFSGVVLWLAGWILEGFVVADQG